MIENVTFVCGMSSEYERITKVYPQAQVLSGPAKLSLPTLVQPGCKLLVSTGLCGGLAPNINIGDCVLASSLVDEAGTVNQVDPLSDLIWHNVNMVPHKMYFGPYYSSGVLGQADEVNQRSFLYNKYGAWAIDDESRFVAAEAVRRKVGLVVLRFVSDDWKDNLPLAATAAVLNAQGDVDIDDILRAIAHENPLATLDLFKVAINYFISLDALQQGLLRLQPVFANV